jgi:Icc-related predicted phosphoesterase
MTRIVAISDTHGKHHYLYGNIPDGDILVHTGDFSLQGNAFDGAQFFTWIGRQKHKHKIVIAGNHDLIMENLSAEEVASMVPAGVTYLNDSGCEVEGLKFWGSPVQPTFFNWAFNRDRGPKIRKHWDLIPNDIDVLLTHGPCYGIVDGAPHYIDYSIRLKHTEPRHVGCRDLREAIHRIKPTLHICGHVHSAYGDDVNNGTTFINASICNEEYEVVNKPYVLDISGKSVEIDRTL